MKPKPKPANRQELQARYFKLNRQRSRAVYERHIAENEGNREAYGELDKQVSDLNEEIARLEIEVGT